MEKLISVQNLTYEIPHSGIILENICFDISRGEFIGLLGENGVGKTTLLDLIMGFKATNIGTISVLGEDPYSRKRLFKDHIAFFAQDLTIKGDLLVKDFLEFHSKFYRHYSYEEEKRLLQVFSIEPLAKVGSLSTGQKKRLQFVAGLSSLPKLILVDEVTAVLDPSGRKIFFEELVHFKQKYNSSILLATNIAEDLPGIVDSVLFLRNKGLLKISSHEVKAMFELKSAV